MKQLRLSLERTCVLAECLEDLRWLFEDLRTPQFVSIKRIQKSFEPLGH